MESMSIAKTLFSQGSAPVSGADLSSLLGAGGADAGGQFGALLSQQLQQPLERAVTGEVAHGADRIATVLLQDVNAAMLADISGQLNAMGQVVSPSPPVVGGELNASDAEGRRAEAERRMFPEQPGQMNVNAAVLAAEAGKEYFLAVNDGKKLPRDLPVESEATPDPQAGVVAMTAMAGAQFASGVAELVTLARKPSNEIPSAAVADATPMTERHSNQMPFATSTAELSVAAQLATPSLLTESRNPVSVSSGAMSAMEIPHRIDSGQWGSGLGDKVVWMVGSQTQGAELRLNPPALGPLEVRVSVSDGQATLSFMTQHAQVREALEAATPRLREMLGDSGISLGNVSVNVGTFAQPQADSHESSQQQTSAGQWLSTFEEEDGNQDVLETSVAVQHLRDGGMVDLFA